MDSPTGRRLKVTVNGRPYLVEVGDLFTSPIAVKVNGQPYLVDIETAEVTRVSAGESAAALAMVARHPPAPDKAATSTGGVEATVKEVRAPMPGHIVDIVVEVGDKVSAGQELCSLEAMKMKNAIRSPRDGAIASVAVMPGQAVSHGDVLFTFE